MAHLEKKTKKGAAFRNRMLRATAQNHPESRVAV